MKKDNENKIIYYIKKQGLTPLKGKVTLAFRWYEPNKRRDLDNIAFAKKFIQDALVRTEIIERDDWNGVAGFTDEFFVDKENPRIEVEIKEVEE